MEYWWFAVLLVALAVGLAIFAFWLNKKPQLAYIIVMSASCVLLAYKTCEFCYYRIIDYPEYPVEFSHFSYFLVGATMCTGFKKTRFFSAFATLAAGLGYMLGGVVSPDSMVTTMSSTYYVVLAVIQHELLFFIGLVLMFDIERYRYRDLWIPVLGTALFVGYSLLVYYHYIYPDYINVDKIVIIKIVQGTILSFVIGEENMTLAIQVVTAVGIGLLVVGCMFLFCFLNNKMFDRRARLHPDLPLADSDHGIFPWIRRRYQSYKAKKSGVTASRRE